jgi:transcriptional regulator with XRE-family HTH domain
MNALSRLWEKLTRSKKYRDGFVASTVKRMIPLQIRVLRKQREWSQAQLATESNLTQGVISRAEDPDYGNLTVNTLIRIGAGFDCAFVGRYVPFSDFAKWYANLSDEKSLEVSSFGDDREPAKEEPANVGAANVRMVSPLLGAVRGNVINASSPLLQDNFLYATLGNLGDAYQERPMLIPEAAGATRQIGFEIGVTGNNSIPMPIAVGELEHKRLVLLNTDRKWKGMNSTEWYPPVPEARRA